jgi:hypothetical protein
VGAVVLAPAALAVQALRALRRGGGVRIDHQSSEFAGRMTRVDLTIDAPTASVDAVRVRLTDTVVRVGEALRQADDVYHLLYREAALDEATVLPVGPSLQELGERVHLVLGQAALTGRTAVWLSLGGGERLVELIDPFAYDPEADDEPESLLARSGMRWGMATAHAPTGPSTIFRVALFVPTDSAHTIDTLINRLIESSRDG